MEAKRGPYSMIGFGGHEWLLLLHGLTAQDTQRKAEETDVDEYLLHPPWLARKRKAPGTRKPGTQPYMQTSCRRLVFRQLLNHRWKHVPDAEELERG
jgi:hypothetical protein